VVAACAGPIDEPADFAQKLAEAECRHVERCQQGLFESEYSDFDDCVDDHVELIEEGIEFSEDVLDCTYVPEHAGLCVSRVRSLDCEQWAAGYEGVACDLVFDCLDGETE
jgi:hypothetical protein